MYLGDECVVWMPLDGRRACCYCCSSVDIGAVPVHRDNFHSEMTLEAEAAAQGRLSACPDAGDLLT